MLRALERGDATPARLAHHASRAAEPEAIVRHGLDAARDAVAARSHREAAALLVRVLEHEDLLPPPDRAAALELLSEEAYYANQPELAVSARRRALALRRELGDPLATGATLRWLSRIHWLAGDRASAEQAGAEAVEQLEPFPESRELAMALSNRAQLAMLAQRDDDALRWGERAIALARTLGDREILVHAQTNVGVALARSDLERGLELLEQAAGLAIEAELDEHAGRAILNAAWLLKEARMHARAREVLEPGLALMRERDIVIYVEYLVATRALIDLATGDWDAADAAAAGLVAQPRLANAVARIPALEVVGLVRLRRGHAEARAHLDEAWELARAADELQRLRPIACARAEAAWLQGDAPAVDAATRDTLALALEVGDEWDVGELALWRFRAGLPAAEPEACPPPIACELSGDARAAARHWAALGEPYAQALALLGAGDARAAARGHRAARRARRDRRGLASGAPGCAAPASRACRAGRVPPRARTRPA